MKDKVLCATMLLWLVGSTARTQTEDPVEIEEILIGSEYWWNKEVTVEGFVRDVQISEANFIHYKLVDFAGDEIWVKKETRSSADYPVLHQKVMVTATVHRNTAYEVADSESVLFERLAPDPLAIENDPDPRRQRNLLLILLLVVLLLLFVSLVLVFLWPTLSRKPVVAVPRRRAAAGASIDERSTPVYNGSTRSVGEVVTPVYYGHLIVEESSDATMVSMTFDLAFPGGKSEAVLGRSKEADITIQHMYLSRRHLRIQHKDGQLIAVKVPGAQEVQIDGYALDDENGVTLESGSIITMPGIALKVQLG